MKRETPCGTYKVEEAAAKLGIGRNQAYEAARRGEIPTIKVGKRILVPKAAFNRMLDGEISAHDWLESQESDPIRARRSKGGRH
jgi:excisionase family DNA binding protein